MSTKKLFFIPLLIILVLPIFHLPFSAQAAQSLKTEAVDKFVTNYMKRNGLPGASIVVVKDGKLIYEKGYGHDSEGNPINEKSLMRIGSTSKSFTSFAVLQLVDEGKIQIPWTELEAMNMGKCHINCIRYGEMACYAHERREKQFWAAAFIQRIIGRILFTAA